MRVLGTTGLLQSVGAGQVPLLVQYDSFWLVSVSSPAALYRSAGGPTLLLLARNASTDVLVSDASLPGSVTLALGQRLVWQNSNLAAPFYPRLSDALGSVYPFSDLRYALAFDPSGTDAANRAAVFDNDSAPLAGAAAVWGTPFFRSSAVFWYRDLFSASGALLRVAVLDANGAAPTPAPSGVPQFETYYATSAQGVQCNCQFGAQPQCATSV